MANRKVTIVLDLSDADAVEFSELFGELTFPRFPSGLLCAVLLSMKRTGELARFPDPQRDRGRRGLRIV